MYKVFFKHRTVHLSEDFPDLADPNTALCYHYNSTRELRELIDSFFEMNHMDNLHIYHDDLNLLIKEFKSCFLNIDAAGGIVLNEHEEFLVIKRNGVWDLPKGKLDKGENFESAALREVEEETGLKGVVLDYPLVSTYHTYERANQRVLKQTRWFRMHCPGHTTLFLQESEGITDSRWIRPGETEFVRKNSYGSILDVLSMADML